MTSETPAVKRALAVLARPARDGEWVAHSDAAVVDPDDVVAEAEAAVEDVRDAADWVEAGGEKRLRAVADDERTPEDLAERADRVLAVLAAFREAATAGEPPAEGEADTAAGDPPVTREGQPGDSDHFHPGRTTLLGGDGIRSDR